MNRIEDDLKAALRRVPAPPGLAAKVFERIEKGKFDRPARFSGRSRLFAIAAMIVMTISAGIIAHRQYTKVRNERALERTLTALSIAAVQLDQAEKRALGPGLWERLGKRLSDIQIQKEK
jgi:hypothetical protein